MKDAECFMLVFSVVDEESFTRLNDLEKKVKLVTESKKEIPLILVANKVDLPNRKITTEQGKEMAQRFHCLYIETSAKTRTNIDEAFEQVVTEFRRIKDGPKQTTQSPPVSPDSKNKDKKNKDKKDCEIQ
jgi:GTPase KRas protein